MTNINDYLTLMTARYVDEAYKRYQNEWPLEQAKYALQSTDVTVDSFEEFLKTEYSGVDFKKQYGVSIREAAEDLVKERVKLFQLAIIKLWAENKQVYQFDSEFLDELLQTDNLAFSKEMIRHLPYENFYLDFSGNKTVCELLGTDGVYVSNIDPDKNRMYVVTCRLNEPNGRIHINLIPITYEHLKDEDIISKDDWIERMCVRIDYSFKTIDTEESPELSVEGHYLLLQAITYLCSAEPDIQENSKQHIIYKKPKPGDRIRNCASEMQKWDVGVRFGNSFRKWKETRQSSISSGSTGTRGSVRPHSRRAHWSHYWYGHGDEKVRRPKWISEILVGVGEPVTTIHKVSK